MPPLDLYDRTNGCPVRLVPLGTGGGESRPCAVEGRTDVIALIPAAGNAYPPAVGEKVEALVDGKYKHPLIGFPVAVLVETHDPATVAGFLVPKFDGSSLAEFLVSGALLDEHRAPLANHVTKTFEAAESLAVLTGDNHPGNWLVECDASCWPLAARRIDPCGFDLHYRKHHRCAAAHLHYVEPELQAKDIATVTLKPKSDRFSLAVILFEILVGDHPALYGWAAEPDVCKRIERRLFACVSKLPPEAKVRPAVTQAFASLPPGVQAPFRRGLTRDRDERPSPAEWLAALAPLAPTAAAAVTPWRFDRRAAVAWLERNWRPVAAGLFITTAAAVAAPVGRSGPNHTRAHESRGLLTQDAYGESPPPDPNAFRALFAPPRKESAP